MWMKTKYLIGIIAVLLLIVIGLTIVYLKMLWAPKTVTMIAKGPNVISGTIHLDGVLPANASITVAQRQVGESQFNVVVTDVTAIDGATWIWDSATAGTAYQLQAYAVVNGNTYESSDIVTTVAPSSSSIIRIITKHPEATLQAATISGTWDLNGYIPAGGTLTIRERTVGSTTWNIAASNLPAVDNSVWSWGNAVSGTNYEIEGSLMQNGTEVTKSKIQVLAAPAAKEIINIDSTAQPAASVSTAISGTITINGTIPTGGTITIAIRPSGNGAFNNISTGLIAVNGMNWSWNEGASGTSYDIQVYLWSGSTPYAQSQIFTTTAPASGETLTINAQSLPTQVVGSTLNVSCSGSNGSMRQATINYNTSANLSGVQSYQISVGTTSGGNQLLNSIVTPSNPGNAQNISTGYILNPGTQYYVQYAYATCTNCNTFSSPSTSVTLQCN